MSTTKVELTTCDLCGYGGPYSAPQDFKRIDDVDLCRWCATPGPVVPGANLECGNHLVTFSEESWSCSCGERYVRPFFMLARVRAAVPSMVIATAYSHVQS